MRLKCKRRKLNKIILLNIMTENIPYFCIKKSQEMEMRKISTKMDLSMLNQIVDHKPKYF